MQLCCKLRILCAHRKGVPNAHTAPLPPELPSLSSVCSILELWQYVTLWSTGKSSWLLRTVSLHELLQTVVLQLLPHPRAYSRVYSALET